MELQFQGLLLGLKEGLEPAKVIRRTGTSHSKKHDSNQGLSLKSHRMWDHNITLNYLHEKSSVP